VLLELTGARAVLITMSVPTRPANASTSLPAITSAKRGTGAPSASRRRRITSLSWWIRADGGSATRAPDQMSPECHPGPALDGRSVTEVLAGAQASAAAQGYTADDGVLSTARWDTGDELTDRLLAVFAAGASLVQFANPDLSVLKRRRATENFIKG
jgi:hypothetical protein